VVLGPSGNNILVDFDESGKAMESAVEIEDIRGWPESIMVRKKVRADILVLVHSVKGEGQMLIKRLAARRMDIEGKVMTIEEVARQGRLTKMANLIWKEYMAMMMKGIK
jgi:hypothetical protein